MSTFKSPAVIVKKNAEEFFNQISDLNNIRDIIPNTIKDFKGSKTTCSFKMEGMPEVKLALNETIPFSKISLKAMDSQVPFLLNCFILERGEQCQVQLEIKIELNMMMRMMVEKPLTNFLNIIATKLEKY